MRENRTHGSEGGEANAFPTPILAETGVRTSAQSLMSSAQLSKGDTRIKSGYDEKVDDITRVSRENALS